jgi:hypothetical protein
MTSLSYLLEITIQDTIARLSGPSPAQVVAYDHATQRATLRLPCQVPVIDPDTLVPSWEPIDQLEGIPVLFPAGGGYSFTFPLAQGDEGMIVVLERPQGEWFARGGDQAPRLFEKFTLNGVVFLPGLRPLVRALPADQAAAILEGAEYRFGAAASEFLARADKIATRLNSLISFYNSHTHAVAGVANLTTGAFATTSAAPLSPAPTSNAAEFACARVKSE